MTVWFVVPAHGRVEKTEACLRQLARTCDTLAGRGIEATAVVVAADANLETARACGFDALERPNRPLGRKWNDGYQHAGQAGADHVVPLGSDDWIDPVMLTSLPGKHEIRCSRLSAVVSEDGRRLATLKIGYPGGDGVRILPRHLLELLRFRPAEDHRDRAIDTSIMRRLTLILRAAPAVRYFDAHPFQIVDWKTGGEQLNGYRPCLQFRDGPEVDPWEALAPHYPAAALDEMRAVYRLPVEVAA